MPLVLGINSYSVNLPISTLSTSDPKGSLTISTAEGNLTLPSNMFAGLSGINGDNAELTFEQGNKDNLSEKLRAEIGDKPLISITLSIDGKQTNWNNPNSPAIVSIPYKPTIEELKHPESILIWYLDGSDNVVSIPNGHYDTNTGAVTFNTTHFSEYAVAYRNVNFNDVETSAWYAKAVSFIAAREINSGTGKGNYSPEAKLTRGEFIVLMMNAYSIKPDANPDLNFSDGGNTWYTKHLATAKRLGLSAGVGNNMFAPNKEITRQEMFTMLHNTLTKLGKLPEANSGKKLDEFIDSEQIDIWAKDAMTFLVETGIISGSDKALNPLGTSTRAEMAQVLYALLGK